MKEKLFKKPYKIYGRKTWSDHIEVLFTRISENIIGFNYSIFASTVCFYSEFKNKHFSLKESLDRAKNKKAHKNA